MRFALVPGALALLVAASTPALAELPPQETRSAGVQITLSPYRPNIDDQFTTKPGPFQQIFGTDSSMMVEVGWEGLLVRDAGALSIGLSAGYWSVEGSAVLESGGDDEAGDKTRFQMLPLAVRLSYRFDLFAERFPLAPVARVGFNYNLWRILDGEGELAQFSPGNDAYGGTYGWHAAAGVHLLLDFFAPGMALDFERDAGVYNSYIIAEYRYSQIDEFGSATSFRLGDEGFVFGLALEF